MELIQLNAAAMSTLSMGVATAKKGKNPVPMASQTSGVKDRKIACHFGARGGTWVMKVYGVEPSTR